MNHAIFGKLKCPIPVFKCGYEDCVEMMNAHYYVISLYDNSTIMTSSSTEFWWRINWKYPRILHGQYQAGVVYWSSKARSTTNYNRTNHGRAIITFASTNNNNYDLHNNTTNTTRSNDDCKFAAPNSTTTHIVIKSTYLILSNAVEWRCKKNKTTRPKLKWEQQIIQCI